MACEADVLYGAMPMGIPMGPAMMGVSPIEAAHGVVRSSTDIPAAVFWQYSKKHQTPWSASTAPHKDGLGLVTMYLNAACIYGCGISLL